MTVFVLFFVELMAMRFAKFGHSHSHGEVHEHEETNGYGTNGYGANGYAANGYNANGHRDQERPKSSPGLEPKNKGVYYTDEPSEDDIPEAMPQRSTSRRNNSCPTSPLVPGDDHLSHAREHPQSADLTKREHEHQRTFNPESYSAQMTAIFILEFGVCTCDSWLKVNHC